MLILLSLIGIAIMSGGFYHHQIVVSITFHKLHAARVKPTPQLYVLVRRSLYSLVAALSTVHKFSILHLCRISNVHNPFALDQ